MRRIFLVTLMILLCGCTLDLSRLLPVSLPTPAPASPVTVGDATRGAQIFKQGINDAPPCLSCHSLGQSAFSLGPKMIGISQRAGQRVPGLSAEDYLRQSILDPSAFLVSGYRNIMYPDFKNKLGDQDLADLIAYLETL
jgi:cytochrome c2